MWKSSKDERWIKSRRTKKTKKALHEELIIKTSQYEEHMMKVPPYKDAAVEDPLIEDAASDGLSDILRVEDYKLQQ